jgi:hypothetical protein
MTCARRHYLGPVLAIGAVLVAPHAAAQTRDVRDPSTARQLLKEGYELAKAGKCADALNLFERSIELDPQPKALLNLARCEESEGRFARALTHWADARDLARERRLSAMVAEAEQRIAELERKTPKLMVRLGEGQPAGVVVRRDDVLVPPEALGRAIPLDPGPHHIEVAAADRETQSFDVTLEPGETRDLVVHAGDKLPTETAPLSTSVASNETPRRARTFDGRPLFYSGLGTMAAGVIVGSFTGIKALTAGNFEDACPGKSCAPSVYREVEDARRAATVSTISFGVAAAGGLVALAGHYFDSRTSASSAMAPAKGRTVSVVPWVSTQSAGWSTTITY